ncbi:usherin isoform X3 [Hyperolius riggenbachi]|uniref:usherin isoform X3 n=1 Tax=Hyperolius riggenbachi TaxID=752182 RepID=UPI0035A39B74
MCTFLLMAKLSSWLHILEALLIGLLSYAPIISTQGLFPQLENLAAFKPIVTEPLNATCGFPQRSVFCQSDLDGQSLETCIQRFCVQDCPYRSTTPGFHQLLSGDLGLCVRKDVYDFQLRSSNDSYSFIYYDHKDCFLTRRVGDIGSAFSLTVWLKLEQDSEMCVIEKSADGQIVFKLTISGRETVFYYRTENGLQPPIKIMTQGRFPVRRWIHLAVQVHYTRISFFINGPEEGLRAFDSRILTDPVYDNIPGGSIRIGQNMDGMEQFVGRMQDFRLYLVALTNRDISEVFSGELPLVSIQPECRCPGSHPRLEPGAGRYCLPNGGDNSNKDKVLRLNPDAHPVSYMNDNDLDTTWISSLLSTTDIDKGITITVDLDNGQYQVFYITMQFYSPMPKAIKIQRMKHTRSDWEDWQYFASDCQDFGMENNGVLKYTNSVNCLQLTKGTPNSGGNVNLSLLTPEPNHRPGYKEFYSTHELQEFVKASKVRIQLLGQYYTTGTEVSTVSFRHRYYALSEIAISGRCNCHGHATACDTSVSPYKCMCDVTSYTDGNNCDRCLPLFNNKPFRQGDQVNAFNCRPCLCYNHSSSCHYEAAADPDPHDQERGGGGVCDNCLHNTIGKNCELCKEDFFLQFDTDPAASDVCQPCNCNQEGTANKSQNCEKVGGQCSCKENVWGRQCDQCKDGFHNLKGSDPDGCQPCRCSTNGTVGGSITCHQITGQCRCKPNIIGPLCDRCKLGYKQDLLGRESCVQCMCNARGSINQFCNPTSGQCKCKKNVRGLACDTCIDNYYGLAADGCKPCKCHREGIIPGTVCDAVTGQCVCQPNVGGRHCDECLDGYYKSTQNGSVTCLACRCDESGSINGSQACDKLSGRCSCKASVTGRRCEACLSHMYNLTAGNPLGCEDCRCDPAGTTPGSVCDPIDGQCKCLPNYRGRRCGHCISGFYFSGDWDRICVPCLCHPTGSANGTCNVTSGQCHCFDSSVSGVRCEQCRDSFYGFNQDTGRCQPCSCNAAGAVKGNCHPVSGQCFCKRFVEGTACDHCLYGASHLDGNNPYGCSATPSQQPPPMGQIVNSTSIILTWNPPDSPNSNHATYVLYRDGLEISQTADYYPFHPQTYTDGPLLPNTKYSYHLETRNVHGTVSSAKIVLRTRAGAPSGKIKLGLSSPISPYSASLNWTVTPHISGPIDTYRLMYTSTIAYEGLDTLVTVHDLRPFTKYNFSVQACNSEGCLQSLPLNLVTAQAPPVGQRPPVVKNATSTELYLSWSPPEQPNGVVIRHDLYMRGVHQTIERRVFHASGWLNPQPLVESENENALKPPVTQAIISNLEPNTEYEFCIVTTNMAGSVASDWVTFKTEESEPIFMAPPSVSPLSSHALNVSWEKPSNEMTRGEVTGYTVNQVDENVVGKSDAGRAASEVIYVAESSELFYEAGGLEPYLDYAFTVTLCNKVGCVTSDPAFGKTLAAAPEGLAAPLVEGINRTSVKIAWSAPVKLNGPSPTYQLERIEPSLAIGSGIDFIKGTHFPGHGYYKFPASTLPSNTYFTGIKIQFRTKEADGLILCAVSAGNQEEYIVLQIRRGRPYFLFDPQDSPVVVTPSNDDNQQYNDNKWHQVTVSRRQNHGYITVDGKYAGSGSSSGAGTVIGENTGVYIGGLPSHFSIQRDDTGDAEIVRKSFIGCLGDVSIQRAESPTEDWESLDWNQAEEKRNVYERWEGCPETREDGVYFSGFGFLELHHTVFPGGPDIDISFLFKTDQLRGLLLFMHSKDGPDYILAELNNGMVTLRYNSNSSLTRVSLWAGLAYCDGQWNRVRLRMEGSVFSVQLNGLIERVTGTSSSQTEAYSAVYVGGVPDRVQHLFPVLQTQRGFGGCMKNIQFTEGIVVNMASVSSSAVRVDLDGCPSTDSSVNCRGNDSIIVYRGKEETAQDDSTEDFTEYLYRVIASNDGGSVESGWSRGRSRAAVPATGQTLFRLVGVSGRGIQLTWDRPAGVRGVIEHYLLGALSENSPNISTIIAQFPDASQGSGALAGLLPFTRYTVTLSACSLSGCSEISRLANVTTLEEAPEEVQAPTAASSASSLLVRWLPPRHPNGVLTTYVLYMDRREIYTGKNTEYNVSGLGTFTAHRFLVSACTLVGCTNSSEVTLVTTQLPPERLLPPVLTVLNSTSIHVKWEEPGTTNGILERYLLHITSDANNGSAWNTVYNSTELFLDYTMQGLIPGTRYFIKVTACSRGGCTASNVTEASTEESIPEGVQTIIVQSLSPDSFNITWSEPVHPNGIITSYELYMDGILMQNSSQRAYFVAGLSPWSKHSFRLQACTAKGCAVGEKVDAYTQETKPVETVHLHSTISSPKSILVKWEGPEKPNGHMTYDIILSGLFYENEGEDIYNTTYSRRHYSSPDDQKWMSIDDLVPFSSYNVSVNASNSQGHVISDSVNITMPPAAPDGVLPPRLSSASPTSLQVVWPTPVRNNAPGLPSYRLQMRPANPTNKITDLFSGPSASLTYTIEGLQPYTAYELRIMACNMYGETPSRWVNISTEQDNPGAVKPPLLFSLKSRSVTLMWSTPVKPNGIITHFNLYQNGSLQAIVLGNHSQYTFHNLIPFTRYHYQLEACTIAGCSLSQESLDIMTHPDLPSDIPPPDLHSDTPTSVMIRWRPPLHPNGLVETFEIERRLKGSENVYSLVKLPGHHPMEYLDQTNDISPWRTYEYRIIMTTINGGSNSSRWTEVTTRPGRPVGVQQPDVTILGPYTAKVNWRVPLLPNGKILSYEVRMPEPRVVITDTTVLSCTVTDLTPYTNYSVTVLACSGGGSFLGGCTESSPTLATTQPATPEGVSPPSLVPVSETFIAVSWQPPSRPNGPDIRFELLRRTIQQPLASNPPKDLNLWQNIYSGTWWFYEDKGLSRYTSYEYRLIVHNGAGYSISADVVGTTLPGPPIRGSYLTAKPVNHTAIEASWMKPTVQDLQGDVHHYTLGLRSSKYNKTLTFPADVNYAVIGGLQPNTDHQLYLEVSNGPHSIASSWVHLTTLDGEPEGVFPPEVVAINSTAVHVIWTPPLNPNGVVTEYSIYVDNKGYRTHRNTPHPFTLGGLAPYTVYNVQVEACTAYACTKSNATQVTTVEGRPSKITSPAIKSISPRSVQISWSPPEEPNGIILGYELKRKTLLQCTLQIPARDRNGELCQPIVCWTGEALCRDACYNPQHQVCCSGVLHDRRDGHQCCEADYVAHGANSSWTCCAGQIHVAQPNYQCCGRYYVTLLAGQVCCYDGSQNRVSIGDGDACCGRRPYSVYGHQICCGENLHEGYNQQCCGGNILPENYICCGDERTGSIYRQLRGLSCCGTDYVNMSETTCCSASNGQFKAHLKLNNGIPWKCCESELIAEGEECCGGIGYHPQSRVCPDKPSTGNVTKVEDCHFSTLCPLSPSPENCERCDSNSSPDSCFWVRNKMADDGQVDGDDGVCLTEEESVHRGGADVYSFTDMRLHPFTTYEYQVLSWNSFGHGFSNVSRVTTDQDVPQGISPPKWSLVGNREDVIFLKWEEPSRLNGIVDYVLLRDGTERYRGAALSFRDRGGIHAFKEYTYQLRACTVAGCLDSAKATAATKLGVPENVAAPTVTTVNSTALHLSWAEPRRPNGVIKEYQIHQKNKGLIHVSATGRKQCTVTGLEPHTQYMFFLAVCTSVGCSSSDVSVGRTSQAAPQGVWLNPFHVTINSSALELYWKEPERPNGMVSQYRLLRDAAVISTRSGEYLNFTDSGLQPASRYHYQLEARTEAGSSISDVYVVETPLWTPEEIPMPKNITVLGPYSVFVEWDLPGFYNQSFPLEFNILLTTGDIIGQVHPAGEQRFVILEDLIPGGRCSIRLQVCQNGSCGVGPVAHFGTMEAEPEDLKPPILHPAGPKAITITWKAPTRPNGIITSYTIHRRLAGGHQENSTLFTWSGGPLEYTDISNELDPYTEYKYCIIARNSMGSVHSAWSSVRTLEATPEDLKPATARATSAYSMHVNWTGPSRPHGLITKYVIIYGLNAREMTSAALDKSTLTVPGTTYEAKVFGLLPATTYHICIEASNSAGSVTSGWSSVETWEAAPSGLTNFTTEKRENGRALLIQWSPPERTNGILLMYNIYSDGNLEYSGLSQQFLFRRLEPYTNYSLLLEACTSGGCTRTFPQLIQTEEAAPSSQLPPLIQSFNASHITLSWSPPSQPNGKMTRYEVIKRNMQEDSPDSRKKQSESVVFRETNIKQRAFTFTDSELHPWTHYEYKIRSWNSVGYTDSPWTVAQTSQAAPSLLLPPRVFHGESGSSHIIIEWSEPDDENGKILNYRLLKNNLVLPFSLDSSMLNYTDKEVLPYTDYTYSIRACTLGGCSTSKPSSIKTLEGPPQLLKPPIVQPLSSSEVNVTWYPPSVPNGEITKYIIQTDDGETYFAGKKLSIMLPNLLPYTLYNISLVACTSGGCTTSPKTLFRTMEAPPSDIKPPVLTVTSAQSIKISWRSPDKPNGDIINYELHRNGKQIYVGLDTQYHDFGLQSGTEYTYIVQASNSIGKCLSSPAKVRTHPSSPSGMEPPQLQVESPNEILATWKAPLRTNGEIVNYTLYIHHPAEMKEIQYRFNDSFVYRIGHHHSFLVRNLKPYNQYEAKVEACTLLGCAVSEWASVHTKETAPDYQPAPLIDVLTNSHAPFLAWNGPQQPNEKILTYAVYRRTVGHLQERTPEELVYNGSSLSFQDGTLQPFTEYEYKVSAVNSAGRTSSLWARCRTGPTAPEGIRAPMFHAVSATVAVANITPPSKPNGIVTLYRLYSRDSQGTDTVLSEGTSNVQVIYGLKPFTNYSIGVEACTCLSCCSSGPVAHLTTQPAPPSHQRPPRVTLTASRAVSLQWSQPRSPNGIIQRYEVHLQAICPPSSSMIGRTCTQGPVEVLCSGTEEACDIAYLQPFTTYSMRVTSYNSEGSTSSEWINCTTLKEKPEYKAVFYVLSNITTIFVDWSLSFQLNGQLKEFVLTERGQRLYSGFDTSVHIPKTMDKTFYFQVKCVTDMGSVSTPIVKYNSATGLAPAQPFPNTKNGTEVRINAIYMELWFIILMALLGLLLLAIFLSLVLKRKLAKEPYPRERPPLVPIQQRLTPSNYSRHETYTKLSDSQPPALPCSDTPVSSPACGADTITEGISDMKISGVERHASHNTMVVRKTSEGQISHSFSQNSLYRSASQLIASHDKRSILDGSVWEGVIQGQDSGMYMDDEDLISTIKNFSTVTKQHTAFTDTPL